MAEELGSEADIDPIRGVRKQIGAKASQDRLKDRQRDHSDGQHMERGKSLMHQHFVDDHLCKKRGQ